MRYLENRVTAVSFAQRDGFIWLDGPLVPLGVRTHALLTHALHYGSAVFEGEEFIVRHLQACSTYSA